MTYNRRVFKQDISLFNIVEIQWRYALFVEGGNGRVYNGNTCLKVFR